MNLNIGFQVQFGRPAQSFTQDFSFYFDLMLIAGVLVVASAALGEIGAVWLNSMRRGFEDRFESRSHESGFSFRR